MMETALTGTVFVGVMLVASLLWSIAFPSLRVWPLPALDGSGASIRRAIHRTCGVANMLVLLASVSLAFATRAPVSGWQLAVGMLLFFGGGLLGLAGYFALGAPASHGAQAPLVASGVYRFSRNPQYLGALGVLAGALVASASATAAIAALAPALWFLLAPFAEEAWLRESLGDPYGAYLRSAPRFLGRPRSPRSV